MPWINGSTTKHGSPYRSVPVYQPSVGMIRTKLYQVIPSVLAHGIWGQTDVPLVSVPCQTSTYCPYRAVRYGTTNLAIKLQIKKN